MTVVFDNMMDGSVIRVYVLPGPEVFELVIGAVLLPLGALLALTRVNPDRPARAPRLPPAVVGLVAAVAGCVGGIYGVGGEAILAPVLIGDGRPAAEVAPATQPNGRANCARQVTAALQAACTVACRPVQPPA